VSDSFASKFDSIEIDRARAPAPEVIGRAVCLAAENQSGFYLVDDANGRFVVGRESGVVSLSDPSWLEREPGAVHVARLSVVERSGARYDIALPLRLTGIVPLMEGAEELDCSASSLGSDAAALLGPG
jgi:hypothetical protein